MKRYLITFMMLTYVWTLNAQEVSLTPKLFTLRNARISTALGFSSGVDYFKYTPVPLRNLIDTSKIYDYTLSVDLYAPNSFLGLMTEATFENYHLSLLNNGNSESFFIKSIEIPIYLKLRFGKIEKSSRLWLLFGASYSKPLYVKRNFNGQIDEKLNQANSVRALIATFGYEQYFGERKSFKANNPNGTYDRMRIVFFIRGAYYLDSRINNSYFKYTSDKSILTNYQEQRFKSIAITVGIKYFFRIGIF